MPEQDLLDICQPLDFIRIKSYTRTVVRDDTNQWPLRASPVPQNATYTATDWEVHPPALTDMLVWFRDTFGNIRVYITENGAAFYDPPQPGPDGIDDPLRCDYLRTHIAAIGDAIERGRSEERRVGKEGVRTCRSRWSPFH